MTTSTQLKRRFLKQIAAVSVASVITMTGCASGGGTAAVAKAAASPEATAAISAATAALKKASSVGGAWNPTGKMIKKAQALVKDNKAADAIKLAKKAQNQGMIGYQQAMAQMKAGPRF